VSKPAVTIDIRYQSGAPCVAGTRIPAESVYWHVQHEGAESAAREFRLTPAQVASAVAYWETDPYALLLRDLSQLDDRLDRIEARQDELERQVAELVQMLAKEAK
jgi:uncharacterized protein (DUF433 family)